MSSRAVILAHHFVLRGGAEFSPASIAIVRSTIESLIANGIRDICVVDGERAHELAMRLELHDLDAQIDVRSNPTWRQAGGAALLSVRDFVEASPTCLVIPADRPLDPGALRALANTRLNKAAAHHTLLSLPTPTPTELGMSAGSASLAGGRPKSPRSAATCRATTRCSPATR